MRALAILTVLALGAAACEPPLPDPDPAPVDYPGPVSGGAEPTESVISGYPGDRVGDGAAGGAMTPAVSPKPRTQAGPRLVMPLIVTGNPAPAITAPAPATCSGIVTVEEGTLSLEGVPVFLFGVNAQYLLDNEFPEAVAEQVLADISRLGVNTVRVWYFHDEDPARFDRLLDHGARLGLRFVVTLEDNVFAGKDWFFGGDDEKRYRPHLERTVEGFRHRPEILAWELINEPNCGDGGYDDDCVKTIRDWVVMAARMVREIDPCRPVSTGLIGAGNFDNEKESYGKIQGKSEIDLASVHRRTDEEWADEADLAEDDAIFFGEVYDRAYGQDCQVLSVNALLERAERVKEDLEAAIGDGADGYLLWDYAAGAIPRTNGDIKHYCSEFGYEADDPLWDKLSRENLPPPVPWHTR